MGNSPVIWGPNNTAINLENNLLMGSGALLNANGPKNYIGNGTLAGGLTTSIQLGTIGTLTNGLPTGTPTFGSGTTSLAISAIASTGISSFNGGNALQVTASAASTAGNMVALGPFAIDSEDRAKMLQFKHSYTVSSGTLVLAGTSSNNIACAFWDATNSAWLSSAGNFNYVQGTGVGTALATMQTGSTTASIYCCLFFPTASSAAFTLLAGSFFLGPQITAQGPAINDWVSYTPTIGGATTAPTLASGTVVNFRYRRVGDSMELEGVIQYTSTTGSANGSGAYLLPLPTGLNIDTTKFTISGAQTTVGTMRAVDGTNSMFGVALVYNATNLILAGKYSASNASGTPTDASYGSAAFGAGNGANTYISFEAKLPVVGWSSNTAMSADTDTRVVAMQAYTASNAQTTTFANVAFTTTSFDTHGAFNGTTYTVPVSGFYSTYFLASDNGSGTQVQGVAILQNGTIKYQNYGIATSSLNGIAGTDGILSCKAGDLITFQTNSSNSTALNSTSTRSYVSINRLSGPAVVQATESVCMRSYNVSGGSLANNTNYTTVTSWTKIDDTHNAFNATSGVYTIPVSGRYQINGRIGITTTAGSTTSSFNVQINPTTSLTTVNAAAAAAVPGAGTWSAQVSEEYRLLAGDTVTVGVNQATGASATLATNVAFCGFSIARVGN